MEDTAVRNPATPMISVVTPCLNRAAMIADAIESVLAQNYPAFEHIVVDGGSTDGTLNILAGYPHLRVVSERDRNLYDAIDKGIRLSTGAVVVLLNSDDRIAPGAFAAAAPFFADPELELVIGSAEIFEIRDGREVVTRRFAGPRAMGLTEDNPIGNMTAINACLFRRSLLDRLGLLDDRFPVSSDKDLWMKMVVAQPKHRLIDALIYRYLSHPASLTFSGDLRDKLSAHMHAMAQTRLDDHPPGAPGRAAYRRWHAWTTGYRVIQLLRRKAFTAALRAAVESARRDAAWPARFLARLPRHWRDRDIRRGAPGG